MSKTITDYKIDYNPWYLLSKCSAGQIIKAIYKYKIVEDNQPRTRYINEWLNNNINIIITEYINMINDNEIEFPVYDCNLLGNLPNGAKIDDDKHHKYLNKCTINELLDALDNRIKYMLERPVPLYYKINTDLYKYYSEMVDKVSKYKLTLEEFRKEFDDVVNNITSIDTYRTSL